MLLLSNFICVIGLLLAYVTMHLLREKIARKDLAIGFYAGWALFALFYLILTISDAMNSVRMDVFTLRALKVSMYLCAFICMIVTFFIVREPRK